MKTGLIRYEQGIFFFAMLLFLGGSFYSCKKEEKSDISISVISPSENSTYYFLDTVTVQVRIQSFRTIEQVEINLKDASGTPVSASVNRFPDAKEVSLTEFYPLAVNGLNDGNYFIDVTVSDGVATQHRAVRLNLLNRALELKAVYFISKGMNQLHVSRLDTSGPAPFLSIPGDFSGAGISSLYHVLFTAGFSDGDIQLFDLRNDGQLIRSIPPVSPNGGPDFLYAALMDERFYVSASDGGIRGYDQLGNKSFDTGENPYFVPGQLVKAAGYLFGEVTYRGSGERKFFPFFFPSGIPRQQQTMDFTPHKLLEINNDSCMIFGEKNGRIYSWYYLTGSNSFNQIKDFGPIGTVYDVIRDANGDILIASATGIFRWVRTNNSSFSVFSQPAFDLELDKVNGQIYCASGTNVISLLPNFQPDNSWSLPDSVVAIKLEYNR